MRLADNIEKLIRDLRVLNVNTTGDMDKRTLDDALKMYKELKKTTLARTEPDIWSTIMRNRKAQFAASAVIIVTAALAISLWDRSTPTAYAIEQTIEAMQKITTVHLLGTTFDGGQIDMWTTVDPETGEHDHFYADLPQMTIVASPNEAYMYDKQANKVTHLVGGHDIRSDVRFGRFIEDMFEVAKSLGTEVRIEFVYDADRAKEVILLVIETGNSTLESKVDPETKLPMSMKMKVSGQPAPGQIGQSFDEIYYDLPLPEGIFEFEIPEGAEVKEKQYQ
jgi:outer membrane lipoprotein-sorting protein